MDLNLVHPELRSAYRLVQQIVDAGEIQPAAQALFCPMLDQ